jgi:UDP-glucose 4-epimerase
MKKILITGGAGFIGFSMAHFLSDKGYRIDLVDNLSRGVRDKELDELCSRPNIRMIPLNVLDDHIEKYLDSNYEFIFHFAAIIGVERVLNSPFEVLKDNAIMTQNLLEFATKQKALKRFVFTSTSEVYAGTLKHFSLQIPTPEETALAVSELTNPRTSYMLSKIYGEALCCFSGLPYTIFRPHNIYGPRMGLAHVIPELLYKAYTAEDDKPLEVYSPNHTRTFCYIEDAVKMMVVAAELDDCTCETLNVGNQTPEIPIRNLAEIIHKIVGKSGAIIEKAATQGSPERRSPDMTKTNRLTGYEAKIDLETGIGKTFEWYRRNVFDTSGISAK